MVRDGACAPPHHEGLAACYASRPRPEERPIGRVSKDGPQHDCGYDSLVSRHECVRVVQTSRPRKQEGAGKAGCPLAPMVRVRQEARGRTTGTGGSSGLPCAMVLTVSFALSSVTMLSCHRRP